MNKTKQIILTVVVALALILALAACGKTETDPVPTLYTVSFDTLGGSTENIQSVEAGGKVVIPAAPEKTGYLFEGWYKDSGTTDDWAFDTDTVSGDTTIYAKWSPFVLISVADQGNLKVAMQAVVISDRNADGKYNIDEAIYAAHEAKYEGGAAAGYTTYVGQYGLGISKFWGDESGCFGYYANNEMAMSLADEIQPGDYVYAYVYTDQPYCSDAYSFFLESKITVSVGASVELHLDYVGFDANWSPLNFALSGAKIKIGGENTAYTTNEDGKVTVSFATAGVYTVSAVSESKILVPPVCIVTVK